LGFVLIGFIAYIFHFFGTIMIKKYAFLTRIKYKKYLLKNVFDLNLNWHNNQKSGDVIDKINKSSENLYLFIYQIMEITNVLINVIGIAIIISFYNIHLIYIFIIFFILLIFIIFKFDKKLVPKYKKLNLYENKIAEKTYDYISNISTILILKIKKNVLINIFKELENPLKLDISKNILNEKKWLVTSTFTDILKIIPLISYILITYFNNYLVEFGTITMIYAYSERMSYRFYVFTDIYNRLIILKSGVKNCEIIEKEFGLMKKIESKKIESWEKLNFKNIIFKYEKNSKKNNLDIENFEINKNEKIAIIGESGSGKTTFLKILRGLYENTKCELFVNKKYYSNNIKDIENNTMLIPQEPEIFSNTILNNINMEIDEYDEKYVKKFCDMAQISKVIEKLPNKFLSNVNEKGVNLSGGEKQRLALARALLFSKNSDIILLDESTSSVDSKNEIKIYENIFKNFKNKTFISTIHKLNLLYFFDKIYIFKNGKIEDSGSYQYLLKNNKKFKKQIEKYNLKLKSKKLNK
jgi:ABC-type bacteriocin/lantibiotic exporter with double-glycine peptidase domain